MAYGPPPSMPYEPFLLGVGVVFHPENIVKFLFAFAWGFGIDKWQGPSQ